MHLAAEGGAAAPINADENRANVIRRGGGLMASVFSGQALDGQADLKVSLQINQKLQTVLEDTLYKNMTFKVFISSPNAIFLLLLVNAIILLCNKIGSN